MPGRITVSMDFEIGWGAIETGLWRPRQAKGVYEDLRPAMRAVTSALADMDISLTWATVGAMISDPADADFDHLPESYASAARSFRKEAAAATKDGRDLFDMVASVPTPQDIGSHTFSHTRFSIAGFTGAQKDADIAKSVHSLEAYGIAPKSFVFPLNHVSDHEILARNGFAVSRTAPVEPRGRLGKLAKRLRGRVSGARRSPHGTGYDTENGSLLYNWGTSRSWRLKKALTEIQLREGLKGVSRGELDLHLWLHPFNLAEVPGLQAGFLAFLAQAAALRDRGLARIEPMSAC